jgi:DedD protein
MDRRVKERLIGASILVVLIVLVVPELLSGPKPAAPPVLGPRTITPEPIRNITVDLATSMAPAASDAEPVAIPASPASAAGSAQGAESGNHLPAVASPAAAPRATVPAAAPAAPAPVETSAPSPISAARAGWAVQLGSFASRANADNLLHQLKAQGLTVYLSSGGSGQGLRYRVRIGPLADRDTAERTAAKLKSLGHVSTIVAPGS